MASTQDVAPEAHYEVSAAAALLADAGEAPCCSSARIPHHTSHSVQKLTHWVAAIAVQASKVTFES